MDFYKPIRIIKTFQVSVKSREDARKRYPHGEINTVPVVNAAHLRGFTVLYKFPQRINVPTEHELNLVDLGMAKLIPQDKELGSDDIKSPVKGSISKTVFHKRRAAKEYNKMQDELEKEVTETNEEQPAEIETIDHSDKKKSKIKEDLNDVRP